MILALFFFPENYVMYLFGVCIIGDSFLFLRQGLA